MDLIASHRKPRSLKPRGLRRFELWCHELEERVTPSHIGASLDVTTAAHVAVFHHATGTTNSLPTTPISPPGPSSGSSTTSTGTSGWWHGKGTSTSNSALKTALQNLGKEIQSIEKASKTTVGELNAIRVAFRTLSTDGLKPTSYSALRSFEDSLVTTNATATGSLTGNATLLAQFEALYTSSPTTQQTTDLTTAYNALAAAVTDAGISSDNITAISTDWKAVLAAQNSTSTATFPYFTLVTGQHMGFGPGFGFEGFW